MTYNFIVHATDVGPVRPEGFPRHRHCRIEAENVIEDPKRVIHAIQRNLEDLTHHVPMAAVEDLPEAIQRRVVDVPRDWVQLFRCVATSIVFFHDTYPGQGPQA